MQNNAKYLCAIGSCKTSILLSSIFAKLASVLFVDGVFHTTKAKLYMARNSVNHQHAPEEQHQHQKGHKSCPQDGICLTLVDRDRLVAHHVDAMFQTEGFFPAEFTGRVMNPLVVPPQQLEAK